MEAYTNDSRVMTATAIRGVGDSERKLTVSNDNGLFKIRLSTANRMTLIELTETEMADLASFAVAML